VGTALKTSTDGTLFKVVLMGVASAQQRLGGSTPLMEVSVEGHMNGTDGTTRFDSRVDEDASIMLVTPEAVTTTPSPMKPECCAREKERTR
jgi:hypothetical protein